MSLEHDTLAGSSPDILGDASQRGGYDTAVSRPRSGQRDHGLNRGDSVGRLVVLRKLGTGGMGVVYVAYDPELDRKVALKFLLPRGGDRDASRIRLLREAQAMAKLSHPNVIHVHDVGTLDGQVYVAMEFIQGRTLGLWLAERTRTWREIVAVFVQVGRGLAAAHEHGLLHRDVKPDNVMVDERGRALVMDFGLARTTNDSQNAGFEQYDDSLEVRATGTWDEPARGGALLGTPAYMAPEQVAKETTDARADQFSFCVALWEALFGERPFPGESMTDIFVAVLDGTRRPLPKGTRIPGWLRRTVDRGLSIEPDERWPTMDALVHELAADRTRRRAVWTASGVLVLGGVVVAGYAQLRSERCTGAAKSLAGVWNDSRRAEVKAAIEGSGVSYAPDAWERIGPPLDAWADNWIAIHNEACAATQQRNEQSEAVMELRMACLERARLDLDAAATVLTQATPEVVRRAQDVVAGLPQLDRCANIGALRANVDPPAASDVSRVGAIRAQLADASARRKAGDYNAALTAVRAAQAALEGLEYAPVRTEVWLELGQTLDEVGEYAQAETALRQVRRHGVPLQQWELVRSATVKLMHVLGSRLGRPAEALALRDIAEGLCAGEPKHSAELSNMLGLVYYAQAKYSEAEVEHRAALEALEGASNGEHPAIPQYRGNLANTLYQRGNLADAEAEYRAVVERLTGSLGAAHPRVALWRNNLASVLTARGMYTEAEAEHRAAIAVFQESLGTDHPYVATSRGNLASGLYDRGRFKQAEAEYRTTIKLLEARLGADHPHLQMWKASMADVLMDLGRYDDASTAHRAILAQRLKTVAGDHPDVAQSRAKLATVLVKQGKYQEAETEHRKALAIRSAALPANHSDVAASHLGLAVVLHARGEYAAAETEHRAGLAMLIKALGPEHPAVARAHNSLGNTLTALGRASEARAEHRTALSLWRKGVDPDHPSIAVAHNDLANALAALGALSEAEAEHRAALEMWQQGLGIDHPDAATARADLSRTLYRRGKLDAAEAECRSALSRRRTGLGDEHPAVASSMHDLGIVLGARGEFESAEAEHRNAVALLARTVRPGHPALATARANLALAVEAQASR